MATGVMKLSLAVQQNAEWCVISISNASLFPFWKELVEYYKHHSLKEGFRSLDTTLQFPYKESENSVGQRNNRTGGNGEDYKFLCITFCHIYIYIGVCIYILKGQGTWSVFIFHFWHKTNYYGNAFS